MLRGYPGDKRQQVISARDERCARPRTRHHAGRVWLEPPPLSATNWDISFVTWGLAEAFLAGPWELDGLVERGGRVLGRKYRWLRPLVRRLTTAFAEAATAPTRTPGRFLARRPRFPQGIPAA